MNALNADRVSAPRLDAAAAALLSTVIEGYLEDYKGQREERMKHISIARAMHLEDYSWRAKKGTIFEQSNIGVPILKSIAVSYTSKFYFDLVGDDTLVVEPQNIEDRAEAEQGQKYWSWELDDQLRISGIRAVECDTVAVEGTCVTKRKWTRRVSYYNRHEELLHHVSGAAVKNGKNKPVSKSECPETEVEAEDYFGQPTVRRMIHVDGCPMDVTDNFQWRKTEVKDKVTHYDNAEVVAVDFGDFVCDGMVRRIEDSALVGENYEVKVWELWQMIMDEAMDLEQSGVPLPPNELPPGWILENVQKLKGIAGNPAPAAATSTASAAPITSLGEGRGRAALFERDEMFKTLKLGAYFLKWDADEDGWPEDIFVIYERTTKMVIMVDYHVNIYCDCKLPYTVHKLFPVRNRWWGLGVYEFLKAGQEFIDATFNRTHYRGGMNANPATWIDESAFDHIPEWGIGARFKVKAGRNGDNAFGVYEMPQREQVEGSQMELVVNLIQLISGVSSAMQGQVANLPSTATATGVESIMVEGQKMIKMLVEGLAASIRSETEGVIRLIQQEAKEDRKFRYMRGSEKVAAVMSCKQIRDMQFDVKIKVSKMGAQQRIESSKAAIEVVQTYAGLAAAYQSRLRPLFVRLLHLLGLVEAEDLLPSMEELQADQSTDAVLQQATEKIAAAMQKIQGARLEPQQILQNDLAEVMQMLQATMAQPAQEQKAEGGRRNGE